MYVNSVREARTKELLQDSTDASYTLFRSDFARFPEKLIPINVGQRQMDLVIRLLKELPKLKDFFSISEGLRIPSSYEGETGDLGIVKQYQFEKWTIVRDGTFIDKNKLAEVVSATSERFQKIVKDKILIAEDALFITATLDTNKYVPQGGVYFGVVTNADKDIKSVLAILNSELLSFLYRVLFGGMHMGSGYLRYRTSFLEELPFPDLSISQQKILVEMANIVLAVKHEDPAADTLAWEAEIDRLVYQLYGLTEEEIDVVEQSVHGKKT